MEMAFSLLQIIVVMETSNSVHGQHACHIVKQRVFWKPIHKRDDRNDEGGPRVPILGALVPLQFGFAKIMREVRILHVSKSKRGSWHLYILNTAKMGAKQMKICKHFVKTH